MATSTVEEPKLPGGYLVTPRVPQGLAAAVEGLTREVIRHSPEDIYVFAAHHFEKLLHLREQCGGVEKISEQDSNLRALREMSQALKMREMDRGNVRLTRNTVDQVGWSLNQTAKVLKRHRSIFGDSGQRISTDEVFRMANQKENHESSSKKFTEKSGNRGHRIKKSSEENADNLWKASTSRTERSWSNDDSADTNEINSEMRSGPKIITRIPSLQSSGGMLAKDIKSELRKNRISSRERRSVRAKPENRNAVDKNIKQTGKNLSSRKSSERQKRGESEIEQRQTNRNTDLKKSSTERKERQSDNENSSRSNGVKPENRALSMDRVKDYVVQRFATTKSLEELQSVNYVEKVQEIIDETGPIIKGKVDELKSGMIGRSKRSSWFEDSRNNRARVSNDSPRNLHNKEHASSKDSPESSRGPMNEELKSRLTETQNLLENVSSSLTKPLRRSRSARSSRRSKSGTMIRENLSNFEDPREEIASISDPSNRSNGLEASLSKTRNLLEDISSTLTRPMRRSCSAKTLRKYDDGTTDDSSDFGTKGDALKTRLDETRNLLEGLSATLGMPSRRIRSAKSTRHRAHNANLNNEELSNSDSQSLSKVSLPAMKSISLKSSPGSVSRSDSDNLVLPAISPEVPKSAKIKEDLVLPILSPPGTGSSNGDIKIGDDLEEFDIPEIPVEDYIPETLVDDVFRDSLNVTPNFDSIPQRPDSLEPEETSAIIEDEASKVADLESKLQEIQKVEKNIEEIFESKKSDDRKSPGSAKDSNIKKKLQELEEAERRIDRIFSNEVCNESKDSPISENNADVPVEVTEESAGNLENGTKIVRAIPNETSQNEAKEESQTAIKGDDRKNDQLSVVTPESLNYTYVLTEGSPYDIPDTVTTVIIPERTVESPESSPVNIEADDAMKVTLSLLPENTERKESLETMETSAEDLIETDIEPKNTSEEKISAHLENAESAFSIEEIEAVEDIVKTDSVDAVVSNEAIVTSPEDLENFAEKQTNSNKTSPKMKESDNDDPSKIQSNIFGEYVKPEMTELTSLDIDFIRGMENRHDMQKSHQDLGRINEELSEELESLEERDIEAKRSMKVETIEESKEESSEEAIENKESTSGEKKNNPMIEEVSQDEQINDGNEEETDKMKEQTESELSPLATRPALDSESSNEAKESSAADEPLESAKCGVSLEEEVSSETRSPESSNEVKETTLTDGLSLSLDPTRPYVPELNLDSLQDITVSSFKMTEDEYDNQGKAESENTNSITETLTSDENHRVIIDNVDFAEEAIMEYIVSSSDRSKMEETHEDLEHREEVVEEPIVKSQVEIKEDICEKTSTYVTGPSNEDEKSAEDVMKSSEIGEELQKENQRQATLCEGEEEIQTEAREKTVVNDEAKLSEVEEDARSEVKKEEKQDSQIPSATENPETVITENTKEGTVSEEKEKNSLESQSSTESKVPENATMEEVVHKSLLEDEKEEKQDLQIFTAGSQSLKEDILSEEKANVSAESQNPIEAQKQAITEEQSGQATSEPEQKEEVDSSISINQETNQAEDTKEDKHEKIQNEAKSSDVKSANLEVQEKEDIKESVIDKDGASEETEIAEISQTTIDEHKTEEPNKSVDLESTLRSGDDGSDEILEENFVEEDTPLAVSRSASQCTTRRVSSGNLARLREDPSLSWTEEVGPEGSGEDEPVPSKIKFSKIGGETIKEQGSDEIDASPDTDTPKNSSDKNDENIPKDSKEYHIYVPDVDAGEDNSTTDSSTVESAVTKIQARVRGFLTRRRLHRGQQNRSSTLGSIPSIQDSIAVDPEKEGSQEKPRISSPTEDPGLEDAATTIQSNYRRYKSRNRLRREDAVQRTTLSLEKSFAESGLQHTGEFHDCVPLPIHDLPFEKKSSTTPTNNKSPSTSATIPSPSGTNKTSSSDSSPKNSDEIAGNVSSPKVRQRIYGDGNDTTKNIHEKVENPNENLGQMFFGQSSNVPIIQFGMNQNITQLVDLVVLAKEEAALQSGYLNFITSVEDNDGVDEAVPINTKVFPEGENNSDSFKEPLALSVTPLGVVIEEVTSSGAENFMKSDDLDPTIASTESSVAPEVAMGSLGSPRTSDILEVPKTPDAKNGSSEVEAKIAENPENSKDELDVVEADQSRLEKNLVLPAESMIDDFIISDSFSLSNEKGFLGPESSVDSMECPVAANEDKNSSRSSTGINGKSVVMPKVLENSETVAEAEEKESSKADDSSSMLCFSMKVQDFLGIGSEDSMESRGRKPILEVTLTPADLMKSKSTSQESQLAGERIESPITMVQMAPERSESLQQEDLSENGCEDEETNGKQTLGESSMKSENKKVAT